MKISYYVDPGHGWYAVKRTTIEKLKLLDKVSPYSYQKGATVYLEEDCDASLILDALEATGIKLDISTVHHDLVGMGESWIRSCDSYRA